ncbi:hypothetical protein Q5762_34930 [Streptomyces sp. P9(2023)]|uniref:hypothetical protein n=1 Tax=Streptomyces sp. P9(2023) TaxID=3064394 RepID=UPI0028F3E29F|nr:hypothetical protein [Streptomyces sp. P9(2023)]MDT9693432.1 hypothetical protein [Streptomyces sp. P9(2023)]
MTTTYVWLPLPLHPPFPRCPGGRRCCPHLLFLGRAVGREGDDDLRSTSFHASGGTTAFSGGTQEIWWNPEQGLRLKASGDGKSGEMYCRDGKTYFSAVLFADTLAQRAQPITVPDRLNDVFVTTESGQGCDVYFTISENAEEASESGKTVDGRPATAFTVSAGGASDTYYLENETARLVRLVAERDGRTSTTDYDAVGEKVSITMPAEHRTMSMDEFRSQVSSSGQAEDMGPHTSHDV